jgi:hypothetical protein
VEVNRALYKDLIFKVENGKAKALVKGEEVNGENTLGMWFRVAGTRSGKYTEARDLLLRIVGKEVLAINNHGKSKKVREKEKLYNKIKTGTLIWKE